MRRLILAAATLALGGAGCHRTPPRVDTIEDGNLPPRAQIRVADPGAAAQLISGFYPPEHGSWRWTMGKFSVALGAPPAAAQKGARLTMEFTLPDTVASRRKPVTLAAAVESHPLDSETYSQAGDYVYSRDVPAEAFGAGPVKVDFALDKFLAAGEIEGRELGLIVKAVGLAPK